MRENEKCQSQSLNNTEKRCLILMQRLCGVREKFRKNGDSDGYYLAQKAIETIKAEMKKNALV